MIVVITGTPGTGKTAVAKEISKALHCSVINERDFALKHKIGRTGKSRELEIPLEKLRKKLSAELKKFAEKSQKLVVEGHLLCEIPLKADLCIVLRAKPGLLEKRLKKKHYPDEKILDNVFCERTGYCLEKAKKNYLYIAEFDSSRQAKNASKIILLFLKHMQTNKNCHAKARKQIKSPLKSMRTNKN